MWFNFGILHVFGSIVRLPEFRPRSQKVVMADQHWVVNKTVEGCTSSRAVNTYIRTSPPYTARSFGMVSLSAIYVKYWVTWTKEHQTCSFLHQHPSYTPIHTITPYLFSNSSFSPLSNRHSLAPSALTHPSAPITTPSRCTQRLRISSPAFFFHCKHLESTISCTACISFWLVSPGAIKARVFCLYRTY